MTRETEKAVPSLLCAAAVLYQFDAIHPVAQKITKNSIRITYDRTFIYYCTTPFDVNDAPSRKITSRFYKNISDVRAHHKC